MFEIVVKVIGCRWRSSLGELEVPVTDLQGLLRHALIEGLACRMPCGGDIILQGVSRQIQKDANLRNRSQLARQFLYPFQ